MADGADIQARARASLRGSADHEGVQEAVVRFHREVDRVLDESVRAHHVALACRRGCSLCCHLPVEVLPPEAFALARWLRARLAPAALAALLERLERNAARTRELGPAGRKRVNLACALLGADGSCGAYEVRPAQCRRFHSTDLPTCEAGHADPADTSRPSAAHPLVAHNAQVVIALAQRGLGDAGLDATPEDLNVALLEALRDGKSWRRWRAGKKAFAAKA